MVWWDHGSFAQKARIANVASMTEKGQRCEYDLPAVRYWQSASPIKSAWLVRLTLFARIQTVADIRIHAACSAIATSFV